MSEITIRQVDPGTAREQILGVLARNLPAAAGRERFDWLYCGNPDGPALVWLAERDGAAAVGASAAHPRRMRVEGVIVQALNLGDFAIDRSQRTLGTALRLLRATLARIDDGAYAFSYDFSNASMQAVYRRMRVDGLGPTERWMYPVSMTRLARDKLRSRLLATVAGTVAELAWRGRRALHGRAQGLTLDLLAGECGDEFDALDIRLAGRHAVVGVRDAAYLNWRYRRNPVWAHEIVCARADGRLAGYAVLRATAPSAVALLDLQGEDRRVAGALLAGAVDRAASHGAAALHVEALAESPVARLVRGLGFIRRESQIGPIAYWPADSPLADRLDRATNWWLTGGDRDV